MNKNLHDIDDLFKNSIDDHLEEVPADVWNNIDHRLDKKQAAFYKRRYFAVRAAAILLILVGGVTIAAILRYHQREKIMQGDTKNTVTTSNEKKDRAEENTNNEKKSNDLFVENAENEEQNTVVNTSQETRQRKDVSNAAVNQHNSSSKKYGVITDDNYSAQKNEEMGVAANKNNANKNKSSKRNETIKYKPVTKSSVDLIVNRQNSLKEKTVEQRNPPITQMETVKEVQRTTHIGSSLLSISRTDLMTSSALDNWSGSPISFSSSRKNIRLRNHSRAWSVSPMYAQNVNLNTLKDDDHFRDPRNNSREAKRTEQETVSFSTGIGVQKQIGRNISLQSGLQYFWSRTNIEPKTIFAQPDPRGDVRFRFSCSSGESYLPTKNSLPPISGDSIKTNFSQSEISYLQVPLLFSYEINFGKFSLMPTAGIQTNFLLSGKLNSSLEHPTGEEEVSSSIDGLRSTYLSGVIQPGLNYKLSDRISFDFNPNINFSLSPINKGTAVKTYQNLFSVGAGIRIKL